jgi:hypothetical protein
MLYLFNFYGRSCYEREYLRSGHTGERFNIGADQKSGGFDLACPLYAGVDPVERQGMPKMGEKTIGFVEKAYDFAKQNPNLVPPYLETAAFGTDFTDAHGFWTVRNLVQQLEEGISGTEMTAGSEAYQAAFVFYKSVKMAAAQDMPGAKAVYEELKTRFPGGKRKTGEMETETVTEAIKKQVTVS